MHSTTNEQKNKENKKFKTIHNNEKCKLKDNKSKLKGHHIT